MRQNAVSCVTAFVFDSPYEMLSICRERQEKRREYSELSRGTWTGRNFSSWKDLDEKFHQPWEEGQSMVNEMLDALAQCDLPTPKDVRRRQRWNAEEGDLDVNRFMHGDDEFFRRAKRTHTHGSRVVSIIIGVGDNCQIRAEDMAWRGAAAIAAINKLEENGYSCEVQMYWRSAKAVRYGSHRDHFACCPVKQAGEVMDEGLLISSLSTWFFRNVLIANVHLQGVPDWGYGRVTNHGCEKLMEDYMNTGSGCKPVIMPTINGRDQALAAVSTLIQEATKEV